MTTRKLESCVGAGLGRAAAATMVVALAATSPSTTGCNTHQCDPSMQDLDPRPEDPAGGFMIDENTFVTNLVDQPWIFFPGNRTLRVWFPPEVAGRTVVDVVPYVGTASEPNGQFAPDAGINYVVAAGQLAEFDDVNTRADEAFGGSFLATNGTCAPYYARFVVDFAQVDASAPSAADAGTPSDAPSE